MEGHDGQMEGWPAICRLFNSISVISGRCLADNVRLCAMEPRLRLERFPPKAGLEAEMARSVS